MLSVDSVQLISWKSATFLLPVYLTYWPRKCHVSPPMIIISTKFEVHMIFHYLVIVCLLLIRYITMWPWPWSWVIKSRWSHGQPFFQVLRSHAYPFPSYDISHLIPLTTSAASAPNHVTCEQGGQNKYIFGILNPTLPIHYATFYDTIMMIKVVYTWDFQH